MAKNENNKQKLFTCSKEDNYDPKIVERLEAEGITDIEQVDPKCIDWLDVEEIMKGHDADYYVIIGQRGDGKSYSSLKVCLKNYKQNKKRFVYMRRWVDDVNTFACSTLIKPKLLESVYKGDYTIKAYNHKFQLCHPEITDKGKEIEKKEDIGYAVAVSEAKHRKGTNYPDTNLIFFDEFIDMQGEVTLANEYNKFENVVNTVKRENKTKIIMCANTVSKYSEYFTKLGINIDKVQQGETVEVLSPNGRIKVLVHYAKYNCLIGYFVGALTTSKMIESGAWEIPPTDEIPSQENEKVSEQLLFTAYESRINATIGCYLRYGTWESYEPILGIVTPIPHEREFLVLRRLPDGTKSSYFHLTTQKSLTQSHYHKLDVMLNDIFDECDIDVRRELLMGRVFCDNMYTADIFNSVWEFYNTIQLRTLL